MRRPHPSQWRMADSTWRSRIWKRWSAIIVAAVVVVAVVYSTAQNRSANTQATAAASSSAAAASSAKAAASFGATNKGLLKRSLIAQSNNHANTVKYQQEVTFLLMVIANEAQEIITAQADHAQTLDEIAALQKEVASVIGSLPAADAALEAFATKVLEDLNAIQSCLASGRSSTSCPPPSSS